MPDPEDVETILLANELASSLRIISGEMAVLELVVSKALMTAWVNVIEDGHR